MDRLLPRTLIRLFLTACFAVGCSASQRSITPLLETTSFGSCNPVPCAKVSVQDLPRLSDSIAEETRELIYSQVDEVLYAPLDDSAKKITRDSFLGSVDNQFKEYIDLKVRDATLEWKVSRTASLLFADDRVVSVKISNEGYIGGAHGFYDERLFSFDTTTGKALSWDDLVGHGFEFPEGIEFALSANFAITQEGIRLHYNPYEIAPYFMGPTDLVIPPEVASGVLRSDLSALKVLRDSDDHS